MAACEGSHFFIRYAEVWVDCSRICVWWRIFTTDFHGFRHGISQIIARVWRFVKRVTISLSESGRRLFSGCAAVSRHHLMVMRLFGNFVAVKRRLRRGY